VPAIALTFDDGPDPLWTPRLLNLLRALDIGATFFPIARRAAAEPALIESMREDGHVVGLHCDEHVRHTERDLTWLRKDTRRALERLRGLGVTPAWWRTPWGDTAPWSATVAAEHDLELIGWTVDSHDWRGDDAQTMFEATCGALVDGAVVLAHDGLGPGAQREGAAETLRYVELVAAHAERHDLRLAPLA
jgi:peptidoglycan-N-acetylglucosamine deacetylase